MDQRGNSRTKWRGARRSGALAKIVRVLFFAVVSAYALPAQTPISIRVASETVPPGGGGQVQVLLTSPSPILTGNLTMDFPVGSFDAIDGIALFSSMGDVSGAAVINGNVVKARFASPKGTFGTNADYPLMTIAFSVPQTALPGSVMPLNLDPSSLLNGLFGSTPLEYKQGTLTIGGSLSITNVVPGGGLLPSGTVVAIQGTGFTPKTRLRLKEIKAVAEFVSASEMRMTLQQPAVMDGQMITVENPDNSSATYFSYLRGVPAGKSNWPILASTVPLFSTNTFARAVLPPTFLPQLNADFIAGLAIQNPNLDTVGITLEQFNTLNQPTGQAKLNLVAGARMLGETEELLGVKSQFGSYITISASKPIQMLGLLGNQKTGVVMPVNVVPVN